MTPEEMDRIIAACKQAHPDDFGAEPATWEAEEVQRDADKHTSHALVEDQS
jgi:hypothetical protein